MPFSFEHNEISDMLYVVKRVNAAHYLCRIGERLRMGRPSLTPPNSAQAASTSSLADMQEPLLLTRDGVLDVPL